MKILVAEDEPKVAIFLREALEQAGMTVDTVISTDELIAALPTGTYDLLLLDRLLGKEDSLDILPSLHRLPYRPKVLVLSALGEVDDKVKGLSLGADDYLTKPFHVAELLARIRTLCRLGETNHRTTTDMLIVYEDVTIDLEKQRVHRGTQRIDLTKKEFQILTLFARHPGKVYSKAEILNRVWDFNHHPESNIVEVTIANLRAKLDRGFRPLIQSQRSLGYWFGER